MRFVYADPPYVDCAHYYDHPDAARWNDAAAHHELMSQLDTDPTVDGWALSCSSTSLARLLAGAPPDVRVAAWTKPFCAYKRNVQVAYSWEPVIWHRKAPRRDGEPVGRDHLAAGITLRRGLTGAKPEAFSRWLLVLFGAIDGDELIDQFPGTGAVGQVFDRPRLAL